MSLVFIQADLVLPIFVWQVRQNLWSSLWKQGPQASIYAQGPCAGRQALALAEIC